MEGFSFDLQRFAEGAWSGSGGTWSYTKNGTTYTVTSSVALTSVTGDPSPERASVYLTAARNPSGATVSMSGNSQVDVGDYRFVYNNTLYKATSTTGGTLVARNVTADSPLTLNASGKELFRVVASDGSYKDYTLDTPGGATVSTNSDGVPIFTVPSGAYTEFLYPAGDAVIVLSGTFRNTGNSSHPIKLGADGSTVNLTGYASNNCGISYTITPGETETAVALATYLRGAPTPENRLGNFTIGNFTFTAAAGTVSPYISTINATIKDGKTYITTSNVNDTITYNGVTYTISSGTSITLVNENDGSNFYISGWTKGDKVTTSDGVTYIMGGSLLVAQYADSDGKTHTKVGAATSDDEISIADLNISSSTFLREICQTDGTITISKSGDNINVVSGSNAATLSESAPEYYFVNPFDIDKDEYPEHNYGKISRTSSTSVSLVGYDPATEGNDKLTSVVVQDGLSVQFNQYLADVEITIENASTTFISRDSTSDFTFQTVSGGGISVDSSAVSLVSGTIHTDNSAQTLAASDSASIYSVSSYSGSDGIDLISSGSNVIVQDIDTGESFNVQTSAGTKNYTLLGGSSLLYELSGSSAKVYDLGIPSGSTGVSATLGALGSGSVVIAPNSSKVLAIGSSLPSVGAVVFDNVTNPSAALASVNVDSSNFTLDTVRGAGSFASAVDSVSLTSGSLSVNKSLVNDTVDFITRYATFRVTDTTSGNFTVNSDANPTVSGATNITLISGSITATRGQNIRLGASGSVLALDSSSNSLTVSLSGSTFSVVASDTAKFSFNGKSFSVDAGNGMTFSINDSAVTVSGLNTGDIFSYDSSQHSVTPAGFMRNNPQSIWIKESDNYSLSGNSVSVADLDTDSNWGGLILVHDNKITVTPSESVTGVLMNDDFSNTFGKVTKPGNNHYQLSANSNDLGTLDQVSINSGSSRTTLSADKNFLNVSLTSARSTLMVTDASSDTFQVTINGSTGETGLVGAKAATLINGSLTADSNISGGVNVGGQLVTSSEKVTLMTGGASGDGSIAGLEVGHEFKVGGNDYTFTNAGLRNGVQLLRGSKPAHDATSMALSVVSAAHAEMVDMIGTASVSGVSINGSYPFNGYLVDTFSDTTQPSKLYGEVTGSSLAGFVLTTVENGDAWENGYTINVNDSTISIDAAFKSSNFKGIRSGAEFVLDTDDSVFTITDKSSGGAIIGGTNAITQTAGLVAAAESGIESITVGENTVYKAGGLELDVSVLSGDATLSSLDEDESFFIAGKEYSVKAELGLMTDNQIFINNSAVTTKEAKLSEVVDESNWLYIATGKDNILTIPPTDEDVDRWIILDEGKNRRCAQVTKTDGTYSIVKDTNDWTDSGYTAIAVTTNNTLNVEAGNFCGANISVQSSGAQFTVSDTASYSVVDSADGAIIGNARNISQTAGTIALSDNRQTITAGGYTMSGAGDSVNVAVSGTSVSVGGLQTGENFKVNGTTYELLANGRFQRQDNDALWNGDTVSTTDGAINVANLTDATKWNGIIQTDSTGNLTIDEGAATVLNSITSAYVVNGSNAASIYGTASKSGTTFTLGTTGRTPAAATFNTITFTADAQPVSLSSDLANVSLKAGSNEFMATRATSGYTVNYDGKALSVDTAQVVSLQSGALVFDGASNKSQTIMANGQSVSAATESVNVSYGSSEVIVSGITTANESVSVNANAYSLVEGDGFTVHILDGTTTVEDLTTGDKFKIDGVTYTYTKAGLAKTATGSDKISYLLKSINPADGKLALSSLQSTSEDIWLGVWQVKDGVVELTTEIESSVILVDDTTNPTKTYGQVERDGSGGMELSKYSGDVGESYEAPASITITDNVRATISADYSDKPVKASDAEAITVYKGTDSYTIGGTIEKFVPESMTFTPASDDEFTISGTTGRYVMTEAGLTKVIDTSTTMLWTSAGVTNYVLPDESSWANMIRLTDDNSLDFTSVSAASGANIIVDSEAETRRATLDYTDGVHDIKYLDAGRLIPNIQTADGTATFKVNFATIFTTGNGTYTINEKAYTGSGLEIDATATSSTLNDGTVTLNAGAQAVTSTNDRVAIGATSGTITATATAGDWDNLGGLSDSDVFSVGDTSYKVYGASTLVQLNSSGNPVKLYIPTLSGGRISYTNITSTNYDDIIALNADNQLDLREKPAVDSAIVVDLKSGEINPTTRIARFTFDSTANKYTLNSTSGGQPEIMTEILLDTVKILSTDLDTTVKTTGTATFTINDSPFAAQDDLTIITEAGEAILTDGTVSLNGSTVKTRYGTTDEEIEATAGTVNVNVASSAVTISAMDAGDVFSVNSAEYTMTSVGLSNGAQLNCDAAGGTITTADLTAGDWKEVISAPSGILTIDDSTPADAFVANIGTPTAAVKYGTISLADEVYTLTQATTDTALNGIILDNVTVQLPTTCAGTSITAGDATFSVTARSAFTIDSTTHAMTNVTAVTLTEGTFNATNGIPVTIGENVITTTSGTMTVGIDDAGIFVGDLNTGEEFTVDGTTYKMTGVGLLDTTNNRLRPSTTPIYYLGETFQRIIAADGSSLNLTDETTDALVFDSVTAPTTHMATLTFTGDALDLKTVNGGINSITLGANRTLTLDFPATINASGTTTVNGATYFKGIDLVIDATADSSTLQSGTITLNATNPTAQATADDNPLEVTNGAIRAIAADGKFTNISALGNNDAFTFGKNYVKTAIGLYSPDDKLLNVEVEKEVDVADLTGEKWQATTQADGGKLTINSETPESLVVDITEDKKDCKLYGALTKTGDDFTLTLGDEIPANVHVDGVKVTLPAECQGSVLSANETAFSITASKAFTINATDTVNISDVDSITLTAGTLLATNEIPITIGENVITTTAGSMTVGIDDAGIFVGDLNTGEEFTVDGTTYKMTGVGLLDTTNNRLRPSTTPIYYLGETFQRIIAADGSSLNLTDETTDALVFDSVTAPTTHMATLTFTGDALDLKTVNGGINSITLGANRTLTLDFPAMINASGTTTVNGATFAGRGEIVLDATADSSTLQSGMITLNDTNPSAQATADDNPLTVTNGAIRATASDGKFNHIEGLNNNDAFTFGKNYVQTAIGLYSPDDKLLNVEVEKEVDVADLTGEKWQATTQATGGELTINSETPESLVVDITEDKKDCKLYGALTKTGDDFTLTLGEEIPASVHLDGVKVTLPAECQGSTLSANETEFSVTASKAFTIDATDTVNISDVDSINLTAGTLAATNEIPITIGENVITTTSGSMTVGIDDAGIFVGNLGVDEEFTVNGTTYKMTGVGLLDTTNNRLRASTTPIYYLGEEFQRIIQADGSSLNLTDETTDALVFDSVTAPTTHMATLTFDGDALDLKTVNGGINSITLGSGRTLTLDFEATINASGTTTVNGATFAGRGDIVLDATATSSTLQSGTITLNATNPTAQATADDNPLEVTNGAIRATASDGKFNHIEGLNNNDAFTFGKDYVKTSIGLFSTSDNLLNVEVEKEVDVADLTGEKWQSTTQADGGKLTINSETPESLVVDITEDKKDCKLYGALTKTGDDFTLTLGDEIPANVHVDGVKVTLPAECQGSVLSANETAFSITASKAFTINATDTVNISDVDSITLTAGTLLATNEIPITIGENVITTTAGSMTVGIDDAGIFVGDLNTGEEFTVDGTTYKMTGVGLLDTTNNRLRPSTTPIYYLGETFQRIIAADGSSLNLTDETTDALVFDSVTAPTTHMATLTFDGDALDLKTVNGGINSITLGSGRTLTLDFPATVNASGTTTVNGATFAGRGDIVLDATADSSTLQSGTITLNATNSSAQATADDNPLTVTNGAIRATASDGKFNHIEGLNNNDAFTFGKDYVKTSIGLFSTSDKLLNVEVEKEVDVADLTGEKWQSTTQADGGKLTINSETPESLVVDITEDKKDCKLYGALTKTGDDFTLTLGEEIPASVHLDGVKVTLPAECQSSTLSANDAEFSVTASKAFTIDATDTVNINNVNSINLTAGTLLATNEIPITVGENVITTTSGTMTVGIDDAGIFVGDLNTGEEFTVNGTTYKMTGVGLLDTTNNRLRASTTPIYYLGEEFQRIIQADGSSLNLTDETTDALVFDSVTAPTTHMATLTFDGDALDLKTVNGGINSITLGSGRTLTLDFEATINASGTTTVNGATFAGRGDIVLDATATSSTLQSGTITLNATNPTAQATSDDNPLTVTNGAIRATAADGKFNHIEGLNNNDAFTFGKDYVKTSIGLFSTSDNLLNVEVEKEVDVADLTGEKWQSTTQADGGKLTINSETPESLVVDITEDKKDCKLYGALTKTGDDFTLTLGDEIPANVHVDGVKVTLPAECQGSVLSANETAFSITASKAFTINATDTVNISDVDSITLTAGTLLATNEIPITIGENVITTTAGSMTVGIDDAGIFVGDLNTGEEFTVDGTTYKMTGVGLLDTTNNRLRPSTTPIYYLGETFQRIIAADGSSLNLTDETTDALVFDSVTAPTTHMATLTFDGDALDLKTVNGGINSITLGANRTLTLDFPAMINASGTTTVNGATFAGRGEIVLDATADSSTLQSGTITLNSTNSSAQATNDDNALNFVSGNGIRATASAGKFTNISALNNNDAFTFGKDYVKTSIGLFSTSDKLLNVEVEKEVDVADLTGEKWQATTQADGGKLKINSETPESLVVDITEDKKDCKLYGALTKSGDDFTLTLGDEIPASVHLDGVKVTLPAECQGSTLSANETEFSVTASKAFTIDATDTVNISDVDSINLTAGTLAATNDIPVTIGENVITTTSGTMTVGIDDAGIFVGDLNTGEEFTVNGTTYKMTGVGLLDTTNNRLRPSTTPIYYLGEEFQRIIQADGSSLNLTDETTDALVFDSVTAPTTHMATLTFTGDALDLKTVNGGINSITLGSGRTLTLDFPATINASGTTTVNGATFAGRGDIVLDATATSSTLQSGMITLNATNPTAQATADDNPLTVTNGAIRATASDGKFNHIEGLNNNDAFTFGKNYVQTAIGLYSPDDKLLNVEVEKEVDVADLTGEKWQATTQATGGELTINSETPESLIVDITDDKKDCKLYGALTKTGDDFTLTLGDEIPASVHIDGVKVTLPAECKDSTLSANDAEFSVTASKAFTIDATDEVNITDVDSINLTAGTLKATNYIPITVGENTITTTGGELTVGVDRQGAFVGGLTLNDTFTIDDENFKLTSVGLLNLTNNRLRVATTDTYHLGEDFDRIIAASGGTLDLTDQTEDAIVCNSVDSPSVRMANLTVDDRGFILQNEDGGIDTVILGEGNTLTVDFPATVNASGTTTVNEVTFDGRGNLVIDADDDLATLRRGTITIRSGQTAQATLDDTALAVNAGTIRARAADGHFTDLAAVNNGDSFTFGGQTYTQSAVGLINGSTISEELAGGTVDLSKLDSAKWQNFFALSGGTLDLSGSISDAIILDSATAPTTKLADLTVSEHRINLRGGEGAAAIERVNVASGANLNVDFETQVTAPAGNVTVNSVNFNAASDVTLHSDGEGATLYTGSVTLNSSNPSVNFTDDSTALSVVNGSITASAFDGVLVAVGRLQARDSFSLDGSTYTQSAVGLINDDLISENLAGTTVEISDLRAADDWSAFIAPDGDTLDLTDATANALVLDNTTDPTIKLATLTVDIPTDADLPVNHFTLADNGTASDVINTVDIAADTNLDVDFITQITAPAGYVAANGQTYLGTTDLLLLSDGETSTLTTGTVTLAPGDTVNTTSDHSVTVHDGDGLSVTASDESIRLDALNLGDDFSVDGTRYRISEGGLVDTRGKLWKGTADYSDGLTLNALTRESNWTGMVVAKDGALSVDDDTLADGSSAAIVDDASNPTKVFGTIARDDGTYSITKDKANSLSSITLDSVSASVDNNLADATLTLITPDGAQTQLVVTASDKSSYFLADATGTYPTVDDVSSIELSGGTIQLLDGQTVTLADDASDYQIRAGNGTFHVLGETFTLDNLPDDSTVSFGVEDNSVSTVNEMPLNSTATIDGTTYTAPEDNAILRFDATDNEWYFHDYDYPEYQVTVDAKGNVLVMPGVRFSKVIASGRTLSDDGKINFAANINNTPVTVINQNKSALTVTDADDYTWTENFSQGSTAKFSGDGISADALTNVAGVSFNLQNTQSLTAGDTKVTATENNCEVGVGDKGTSLSVDKPAQISAPAGISLTLNAGDYSVNEVNFVTNGSTSATTITDGVKFDLAQSDTINYDDMTFSTDGTAAMDNSGGVSVTSGAVVTNTNDRAFTLEGDVLFDDRPFYSADASTVTIKPNGFDVGERNVRVLGDDDLYAVSLANDDVTNLDSVGSPDGVTVNGLYDATVQTDKVGSLTTDDKTFSYDKSSVTFGYNDGAIASIDGAKLIVGDFTSNVKVNGDDVQLIGDEQVSVVGTHNGVSKILMDREGTYTVNGKTYTISDDDDYAFRYSGGVVAGVESLENGSLVVNQDESGFTVSDDKITLSGNSEPVSLGIVDSHIESVSGADGSINGLGNATVYGITNATINNKPINVSGSDTLDAIVTDKVTTNLIGLTDGATVNSAPDMRITTAENGTFTFPDKAYTLNDTLDATFDFLTNSQSHVKGFDNYSGSISGGDASGKTLNGDTVNAIGDDLVIYTDGDKITDITGMEDGSEVNGDFGNATLRIPEGNSTINGIAYTLEGDEDGAYVSGNGSIISGVDKDATLAVGKGGVYDVNGKQITLQGGDSVTANYDGAYKIDPSDPPITEKTDAEKVLARGENPVYIPSTAGGSVDVDLSGENDLAVIDSPNVNAKVQTGAGGDSVVVRHGASADVELSDTGSTLIIPTAGRVTLENYNGDNAAVRTYDYSDIIGAVKSNDIKFGDGTMTLGDAIVTYDAAADRVGETSGNLYNAHGQRQAVGFTHTAGGTLDKSDSNDNWLLKGNYAESSDDTQKSGGSSITGGSGDDTILGGGGDYIDGGTGTNQIYLTDETLRRTSPTGATIVLNGGGSNVVHNFSEGFAGSDDNILIRNLTDATFGYGTDGLVLSGTNGRVTFENLPEDVYAHELKLTDGTATYNAAVAKENELIEVSNGNNADIFYGNAQGLSFSEYTGAVEMNLNESGGTLDGRAVQLNGINKVTGGAGLTTLIGSTGADTLEAGTGSASIWGNAGHDLLRGNTSADKQGATTFYYEPGDGRDTITNFDFMAGTSDVNADRVMIDDNSGVTSTYLRGNDVLIGINNSADDYLTLANAKGQSFRLNNDLIAKVDDVVQYDGFTNCYVGAANKSTMQVGAGFGDVEIWMSDDKLEYHGTMYDGEFGVLDASAADGRNILAGGENDNLIIGGTGSNSIWGGYTGSNDTLVGGAGQNTFFFGAGEGHDVIQGAHDGDLVSLEDIFYDDVIRADITEGGAYLEMADGSTLEIQSTANLDYRLADGSTYTINRATGEWNQK